MKRTVTVAALIAAALLAGASSCESLEDAKVTERDKGPARSIINMPDGYSNVGTKCDGPNMIYVIYHGNSSEGAKPYGSVAVVANDPRCVKAPQ